MFVFFFFSSRRRHTRFDCDWSSDVCSSDLLSLAIGRNGQNVRLASELTGWKIDLYSSREWLERGGEGPLFAPLPPVEDEAARSEEHTSELQSQSNLVCRLLLEKKQTHEPGA